MADDYTLSAAEAAALRQGFKYCPRCRTELVDKQVYDRVRRVCPACRFIQFIDPKVSAAVMPMQQGQVLLLKRAMEPAQGDWCFPGGFMEIGETPQETARRECLEETGLAVEITRLVDVYYYEDFRGSGVVIMYQGQVTGGHLQANPVEASAARFFSPNDLPANIAFDSNVQALAAWQKNSPTNRMPYDQNSGH